LHDAIGVRLQRDLIERRRIFPMSRQIERLNAVTTRFETHLGAIPTRLLVKCTVNKNNPCHENLFRDVDADRETYSV
jgi:hypothetical protein